MTLAELIADLEALPWVASSFESQPYCVTPNGENGDNPSNYNVYDRGIIEIAKKTAKKRTVRIAVLDKGTENEQAWYENGDPQPSTQATEFRETLKLKLATEIFTPGSAVQGFSLVGSPSEEVNRGLVKVLEDDPDDANGVVVNAYLCWLDANGDLVKRKVNGLSSEALAQIANV